jgi:UrcA family protein
MVRKLIASTAIVLTLGLGSAVAGPTTVVYGDLNLATPTGTAALADRLQTAATAFCSTAPAYDVRHLVAPAFASGAATACIRQVKRDALFQFSAVAVTPQQLALK